MDLANGIPEALMGLVGSLGTLVGFAAWLAKQHMKRNERAMASVPPSQTQDELREHIAAINRRLDTHERDVRLLRAMQREQELAERVSQLEKELREALDDLAQARDLAAQERLRRQKAERELLRRGG